MSTTDVPRTTRDGGTQVLPMVSVVVPVYNDAARLRRCVAALAAQDYPADRFEVLVVDNASSEPVAGAVPTDDRFTLLHETRRGSYAARNTGVAAARGEVLAFTDADCMPRPDWLRAAVAALSGPEHPDAVGGMVRLVFRDGSGPVTGPEHYEALHSFRQERYVRQWSFAATANLVTWRDAVDRVGPFAVGLLSGGDLDWGSRLAEAGGTMVYAPAAVVEHPSRPGWRDLVRKSVRVANGLADRSADVSRSTSLRRAVHEAKAGVSVWWHVWRRPAPEARPPAATATVRYAAAYGTVRVIRAAVHLRRATAGAQRRAQSRAQRAADPSIA